MKQDELAKWCGVATRQTINNTINSLVEKGLIRKFIINKDGKNLVAYSYTGSVKNFDTKCKKFLQQEVKKLPKECQKFLHKNNIEDKKEDNIKDNTAFVPPSVDEVHAYCTTLPIKDPLGFAYFYVGHFENTNWVRKNGEPLINWKNNIREVWLKNNKDKDFSEYIPQNEPKTTIKFAGL